MEKLRFTQYLLGYLKITLLVSFLFLSACSSKSSVYFSQRAEQEFQFAASDRILILAFDKSSSARGVLEAAVAERFKARGISAELSTSLRKSLRDEVTTPAALEELLSKLKAEGYTAILSLGQVDKREDIVYLRYPHSNSYPYFRARSPFLYGRRLRGRYRSRYLGFYPYYFSAFPRFYTRAQRAKSYDLYYEIALFALNEDSSEKEAEDPIPPAFIAQAKVDVLKDLTQASAASFADDLFDKLKAEGLFRDENQQ